MSEFLVDEQFTFSTSGNYRVRKFRGELFVVGQGFCSPCDTPDEAEKLLHTLQQHSKGVVNSS